MLRARALIFATSAAGLLGLATAGCTAKKPETAPTEVPQATEPAKPEAPAVAQAEPLPTVRIRVQAAGLEDSFAAIDAAATNWSSTPPATDTRTTWSNMLRGAGFTDSFLSGIDLSSRHDVDLIAPTKGSSEEPAYRAALSFQAAIAALDPAAVANGLPPNLAVNAVDENTWSAKISDLPMILRRAPKHLLFGKSTELADASANLPATADLDPGRRIAIGLRDLPPGLLKESTDSLPDEVPNAVKNVLEELDALTIGVGLGTQRDADLVVSAHGPFDKLGLTVLGAPAQQASDLAQRLPGDALAVVHAPWGDPQQMLAFVGKQTQNIPEPFAGMVANAKNGLDQLMTQVRDDVVAAVYLDGNGKLGLLVAAKIKDAAATDASVDALWNAVVAAGTMVQAATGEDKNFRFEARYQAKSKIAGKPSRLYTFTPAIDHLKAIDEDEDLRAIRLLFDGSEKKPQLRIHTLVDEQYALLAVGAGGASALEAFVKGQKKGLTNHLESDGGLARARALTQGCQICVAVDATQSMRLIALATGRSENKIKQGVALAKRFAQSKLNGDFVFAIRAFGQDGRLALSAPKEVLFADPAVARSVRAASDDLDALDNAAPPKQGAKPEAGKAKPNKGAKKADAAAK
jgi:hypothetical protein